MPQDRFPAADPYDGRHACATNWLRAGVPLGEAARWLGHSVETLVSTYIGALDGDDTEAKKRIDTAMRSARAWMVEATEDSSRALPANHGKTRPEAVNNGERS